MIRKALYMEIITKNRLAYSKRANARVNPGTYNSIIQQNKMLCHEQHIIQHCRLFCLSYPWNIKKGGQDSLVGKAYWVPSSP
jgi:hypothetical protein